MIHNYQFFIEIKDIIMFENKSMENWRGHYWTQRKTRQKLQANESSVKDEFYRVISDGCTCSPLHTWFTNNDELMSPLMIGSPLHDWY